MLPIRCRDTLLSKTVKLTVLVILMASSLYLTGIRIFASPENNSYIDSDLFSSYGLFIFCFLYFVVASPEILVLEHGFFANYIWTKKFILWQDIVEVRKGTFRTYIFTSNLPKISYIIGLIAFHFSPAVLLSVGSENHDLALKRICENVTDRCK